MYLVMGVAAIVLGIGSTMARRWAQALILVTSWMWLILGVIAMIAVMLLVPQFLGTLPPEQAAAKPVIMGCLSVIFGLFFILLPLAFVLFYRRPNVRATVEARDPVHRWTDDIPLPLLGFGVWMIFGAASMLACGFLYPAFPLGRWMLRGPVVPALILGITALLLFIGIGSLKRMKAAWWAALGMLLIGAAFTFLLTQTNFPAWYAEIGMPMDARQAAMIQKMYSSPYLFIWMGALWIGYFAFLFYVRRYFWPPQNVNRMYPPST
jgi:hypothetical protein